jgi:hypothetical protein
MLSQLLLLALVVLAVVVCLTYVYKDIDKGDTEAAENGEPAGNGESAGNGEPGNGDPGDPADNAAEMAALGGTASRILKRQSARQQKRQ